MLDKTSVQHIMIVQDFFELGPDATGAWLTTKSLYTMVDARVSSLIEENIETANAKLIQTEEMITGSSRIGVSFFIDHAQEPPNLFQIGQYVRDTDNGIKHVIESFIWFEPVREHLYKIRNKTAELAPSGWYAGSRLVSQLAWEKMTDAAREWGYTHNSETGRFHRGNHNLSVKDMVAQKRLINSGHSPRHGSPLKTNRD